MTKGPSAATALVQMARQHYTMHCSTDGTVFAVPIKGVPFTYPLRGGKSSMRATLARRYYNDTGSVAPQQALADALIALEGEGQNTDPIPVHLRVAYHDDAYWLDLGDSTGKAVRLTADGWEVTTHGLPLFRRTALTGKLPEPSGGGDVSLLWEWLNVSEEDRPVVLAWLISTLLPGIPHPVVGFFGEQGTGKTTAGTILSSLVDPSPVPVRKAPRDSDGWVTAASGSWIVALDNLSVVPDWLSDTLCRAVTGDGDVRRQLYTDGGLVVFSFRRCVIITGIDLGAVRGDLADRLLPIDLHRIGDDQRKEEQALWPRWRSSHPDILAGLLDLAASVLAILPFVDLASRPRMADFARVLAAVDKHLSTDGFGHYSARAGSLAADSLTGDPFIMAVQGKLTKAFEGTSADLLNFVQPADERWRPPKGWPANARAVTALLRRQAPTMRRVGWTADELPSGHENAVRWRLCRPELARNEDSQGSQDSQGASDASDEYRSTQGDHDGPCARCGARFPNRYGPNAESSHCPDCRAQ